jgi:hypothetical protein
MKITVDNKRTSIDFAELVEGEAFMTLDGASIYIYCTFYYHQDNQLNHLVMKVTDNGLIPLAWFEPNAQVIPLEVQGISFSTSTLRNTCSFCD